MLILEQLRAGNAWTTRFVLRTGSCINHDERLPRDNCTWLPRSPPRLQLHNRCGVGRRSLFRSEFESVPGTGKSIRGTRQRASTGLNRTQQVRRPVDLHTVHPRRRIVPALDAATRKLARSGLVSTLSIVTGFLTPLGRCDANEPKRDNSILECGQTD